MKMDVTLKGSNDLVMKKVDDLLTEKKADRKAMFFSKQKTKAQKEFDRKKEEEIFNGLKARAKEKQIERSKSLSCSDTNIVYKTNNFVQACYEMTLVESQLLLFAIARSRESQKGLSVDNPIEISANDFSEQFKTKSNAVISQLRKAVNELYEKSIYALVVDEKTGVEEYQKVRLLEFQSYTPKTGVIKFAFSNMFIKMINSSSKSQGNFTYYYLNEISRMTSVYAIRIYELIKQYKSIGKRPTLDIQELRDMLLLNDKHPLYSNFKKRVLDVAIEQIREFSDLKNAHFKENKIGQKVVSIDFLLK